MGILKWAVIFAIAAVFAAVLGFGGLSESLGDVAQVLFWAFVAIAVVVAVLGVTAYRKIRS